MRFDSEAQPGIRLNVLLHRRDILDLSLFQGETNRAEIILSEIFQNKEGRHILNADESTAKGMRHLYFESKNIERISGTKSLSAGYPLFAISDNEHHIVAPIFLISFELEPLQTREDSWSIAKNASAKIQINPEIKSFFKEKFGSEAIGDLEAFVQKKNQNFNGIKSFSSNFSAKNGLEIPSLYKIFPIPGIFDTENIPEKGKIFWSGILGIFPEDETISPSEILDEKAFFQNKTPNREEKHPFGILQSDPWQESAFQGTLKNENFLVNGSTGTGKSQVVLNILSNALSNGEKCLVVSNRVSVLNKLQEKFAAVINAPLHFLLKNENVEKSLLLAMLKASAQSNMDVNFDQNNWNFVLNKTLREKKKLDRTYHAVNDPIFGIYNWTDTVGLFLKNNAIEGKEKLASQLKPADFKFNFEEYENLDRGINSCHMTYGKVNTTQHPLTSLNHKIFDEETPEAGLNKVKEHLGHFKTKCAALHQQFINRTDSYRNSLQGFNENKFRDLSTRLEEIDNFIEDSDNKYGKEFSTGFFEWIGIKSYFSKKNKKLYQLRNTLVEKYEELHLLFETNKPFESDFSDTIDTREVSLIQEKLAVLKEDLSSWRSKINNDVQEEMIRLTNKSIHPELAAEYQPKVLDLEEKLDALAIELNDSNLFQTQYINNTLTLPKRQKFLEEIIEKIEQTDLNLGDFDRFFDWQKNWLGLSPSGKKAVRALIMVKAGNWSAAFRSWYLHNFLNIKQSTDLPKEDASLGDFVYDYLELKKLIPAQIANKWATKKAGAIAKIKIKNRNLYNYFDGKNDAEFLSKSLKEIAGKSGSEIMDMIPVLFCTPQAAASFLNESEEPVFDRVIFEEAQLLDLQTGLNLSKLAKQRLIIGDSGPNSSEIETDFLNWAIGQNIPGVRLKTYFGERVPALINYNAAAFLPEEFEGQARMDLPKITNFKIEPVNGRYSEADHTNEAEAHQVLYLLNQIKQTPQRTYPSVGVACFTSQQRDLVLHFLQDIKKRNAPGAETIRHLERNGFGVFYIGNMSAEQFDLVIVSLTFGALNTRSKMTPQLSKMNTDTGLRKMYALANAPRKEMIFLHSIPENVVEKYAADKNLSGLFRLANFIKYGEALSNNNRESAEEILKTIQTIEVEPRHVPESIYNSEAIKVMRPYFETGRVGQNLNWSKMNIPIYTTDHSGALQSFIEADGFMSHAPETSYLWEFEQREKIKAGKMEFIPIWSVQWWKNAQEEARKLAGKIIQMDKKTEATS